VPHVTLIHGIANKPRAETLQDLWLRYLSHSGGLDLNAEGVTSTMVYWADVLYDAPKEAPGHHESNDSYLEKSDPDIPMGWRLEDLDADTAWVESLASRFGLDQAPPGGNEDYTPPVSDMGVEFERIPLPWWLKKRLMKALVRDVHHYLFDVRHSPRAGLSYAVQEEIRARTIRALQDGAEALGPHVVVSHSMGTVVAYDCLERIPDAPEVDGLLTIGSPLGLDEVQDKLRPEWSRDDGYPAKVGRWVNVYDRLDPVAGFDPALANDFRKGGLEVVEDIHEPNSGRWRHSIQKYFGGSELVGSLRTLLDLD
jgi:hypothetical protein